MKNSKKNNVLRSVVIIAMSLLIFGFIGTQEDIWEAPEAAKKIKNPVTNISASAKKGKKLFRSRCAICHGAKGFGDGPGSKALTPKPANLSSARVQGQVDGQIFWKITNGRNDMIKWGPILSEEQRWDLVNYVRTLK